MLMASRFVWGTKQGRIPKRFGGSKEFVTCLEASQYSYWGPQEVINSHSETQYPPAGFSFSSSGVPGILSLMCGVSNNLRECMMFGCKTVSITQQIVDDALSLVLLGTLHWSSQTAPLHW